MKVSDIAKMALDGAGGAISDAVHSASLAYDTQGAYNATTGQYAVTTTTLTGGRLVVDTVTPGMDIFPDYTIGPGDELLFLESFTSIPAEAWEVTANGITWEIMRVQDIAAAGSTFYAIGRRK